MKNRIFQRFELAVSNFGRSCINLNSNERTFQGWYASMVIQEFGLSRVYRDVDVSIEKLFKKSDIPNRYFTLNDYLTEFNQFIPDLLVSWEPNVDSRNESIREDLPTTEFLNNFGIVTELKVTGSTVKPTTITSIRKDICKLGILGLARKKERYNKPIKRVRKLGREYMVIVDNFRNNENGLKPKYEKEYFEDYISEPIKNEWINEIPKPEILLILPNGKSSIMHIYSNFRYKESI